MTAWAKRRQKPVSVRLSIVCRSASSLSDLTRIRNNVTNSLLYTLSHWKPEKALAIRSWIGSPLLMIRGRFLSAKERTALQAVMRHPRWSRGEARWFGPCGHHSVSSPRSSNRTCGFPASGFPTGFTSKHTAVGQDGPDVVGSHRTPRTRPYRGNAWCLATTPCGRFRLRLDVELPLKAPDLLRCRQVHCQSPLLAIVKSVPEVRALCSADITRPHSSYGPVRRPRGPSPKVTSRARPSSPPGLPRLPVSLFQRAVPSTPADQDGCTCRLLPRPARPSPYLRRVGIRDFNFRGLLRLHSNYGPLDRSTAQGGLCHRASIHPVTRTNRLPATRSNRQLSGWFLPPLAVCRALAE